MQWEHEGCAFSKEIAVKEEEQVTGAREGEITHAALCLDHCVRESETLREEVHSVFAPTLTD